MSPPGSLPPGTQRPPRSRSRPLALLDALARTPFLRAEDLALELDLSPSQSAAHLRALEAQRAIAHVSRPTGPARSRPTHLYFLRPAGLAALRQEQADTSIPWWGTQDRRLLALLPRLDRLLVGHAFLHALLVTAPQMLGEQGRAAQVRWTWIRDYQQSLPPLVRGPFAQAARLFADWLLVLRVRQAGRPGEQIFPLFVLLDHACLPQKQIRARLQTLLHARALAADRYPQTQGRFPLVLILLPGWQRARHWQRLAAEINRETEHPLRGCLAVVSPTQQDGWRLPWQTLHRYGPCENPRTLLCPYPPQACPPAWLGPCHHGLAVREQRLGEPDGGDDTRGLSGGKLTNHLVRQLDALRAARKRAPHLAGVALERAHYRILEVLCVAPFLTPTEIAAFLGLHDTSVQQYIAEMQAFACLAEERLREEEPTRRLRLSSQGMRLLALRHHLQFRTIAVRQHGPGEAKSSYRQKGLDMLRRNATLTCGVYAFFAQLAREAPQHGHHLLWWETASAREQSYYSLARAAWRWEKPHGMGEYQAGSRRVRFWLEWHAGWNPGSNRLHALAEHLAGYASYIRAREWSREGHVLPLLLLVCPDGARERQIQHLVREQLGELRPRPIVLSTTRDHLSAAGPLAPIWKSVLLPLGEPEDDRQVFYGLHAQEESE